MVKVGAIGQKPMRGLTGDMKQVRTALQGLIHKLALGVVIGHRQGALYPALFILDGVQGDNKSLVLSIVGKRQVGGLGIARAHAAVKQITGDGNGLPIQQVFKGTADNLVTGFMQKGASGLVAGQNPPGQIMHGHDIRKKVVHAAIPKQMPQHIPRAGLLQRKHHPAAVAAHINQPCRVQAPAIGIAQLKMRPGQTAHFPPGHNRLGLHGYKRVNLPRQAQRRDKRALVGRCAAQRGEGLVPGQERIVASVQQGMGVGRHLHQRPHQRVSVSKVHTLS